MVRAMAKPPITANQVTFLRLILLPIGGALFYCGLTAQWINLVFMTLLGCTDFVDGWLARKYGSTELGRLMDPIADKVFVVVIFMPFIDLNWMQPWQVLLLLSREFVVTALRSTYERLKISPKTAFLAKVKAWAQMAGCGVLFMMRVVPEKWMFYVLLAGTVLPVAATLVRYFITGYIWRVSFIMAGWFGVLLALQSFVGSEGNFQFLTLTILGITWLSAWTYLVPAGRLIFTGKFGLPDWVRLLAAIALPILLVEAQARPDLLPWVIMLIMCLEMAVGGLDNLLCVHGAQSSTLLWGLRVGLVGLLTGLALRLPHGHSYGMPFLYVALFVSLWGTAVTFYRGRNYYLEEPRERSSALADD
jgi:cardiolipin synthase